EKGVIHCDVKPNNLLVAENGTVKILDLGMARFAEDATNGKRSSDGVLGTVDYMAPELALGRDDIDARVDIYSLGCTLFFLLTGKPPFPDGTLAERILKHQSAPRPSLRDLRPETPADLDEYCRRMMAISPDDRPASAAEVADFLAEWEPPPVRLVRAAPLKEDENSDHEEPARSDGQAPEDSEQDVAGSTKKTRLLVVAGAGVLVLLLTVGLVAYVVATNHASPPEPPRTQAPQEEPVDDFERQVMDIVSQWSLDNEDTPPGGDQSSDSEDSQTGDRSSATVGEDIPEKPAASNDKPSVGDETDNEEPKPRQPGKSTSQPPTQQDDAPATTNKPDDEASTEPPREPEEPANGKSSPEKPKQPDTPKPPPKPRNPFERLPATIDLAVPSAVDESPEAISVSIARFTLPQPSNLDLRLLGGAAAIKGAREFSLENTNDAGWKVLIRPTGPTGGDTVEIARVAYASDELTLHWSPEASPLDAAYLMNCALRLQYDEWSHTVQFRKPIAGPPISLDMRRPISAGTIPLKTAPDTTALQVIFFPPKAIKDVTLDPPGPHPLKDPTTIRINYRDRHGNST
ncbi:MAG: serine/threonine protein kinase, partial [Planctomycetota bacterium]